MDNDIKTLEERKRQLEAELKEVKDKIHSLRCASIGINLGDVVIDRSGNEYKVTSIEIALGSLVFLKGCQRKKNGEFGNQEVHLYDGWQKADSRAG